MEHMVAHTAQHATTNTAAAAAEGKHAAVENEPPPAQPTEVRTAFGAASGALPSAQNAVAAFDESVRAGNGLPPPETRHPTPERAQPASARRLTGTETRRLKMNKPVLGGCRPAPVIPDIDSVIDSISEQPLLGWSDSDFSQQQQQPVAAFFYMCAPRSKRPLSAARSNPSASRFRTHPNDPNNRRPAHPDNPHNSRAPGALGLGGSGMTVRQVIGTITATGAAFQHQGAVDGAPSGPKIMSQAAT